MNAPAEDFFDFQVSYFSICSFCHMTCFSLERALKSAHFLDKQSEQTGEKSWAWEGHWVITH
jgi:hypothetical protein